MGLLSSSSNVWVDADHIQKRETCWPANKKGASLHLDVQKSGSISLNHKDQKENKKAHQPPHGQKGAGLPFKPSHSFGGPPLIVF